MTHTELRQTEGYREAVQKITNYKKGFEFTLNYNEIPKAKGKVFQLV